MGAESETASPVWHSRAFAVARRALASCKQKPCLIVDGTGLNDGLC